MKHEFTKMLEKCTAKGCSLCKLNSEVKGEENQSREIKADDSLYKKEVEQYYFYFLENKAS